MGVYTECLWGDSSDVKGRITETLDFEGEVFEPTETEKLAILGISICTCRRLQSFEFQVFGIVLLSTL